MSAESNTAIRITSHPGHGVRVVSRLRSRGTPVIPQRQGVHLSTDAKVTKDLVQTCKDGEEGFAKAAAKLAESGRDDLANQFREFSQQRGRFATELEGLAANYGDDAEKSSSVATAIITREAQCRPTP